MLGAADGQLLAPLPAAMPGPEGAARSAPAQQKWLHGLELTPGAEPTVADDSTRSPFSVAVTAMNAPEGPADSEKARADFHTKEDPEERRRWMKRFGCIPEDMQMLS